MKIEIRYGDNEPDAARRQAPSEGADPRELRRRQRDKRKQAGKAAGRPSLPVCGALREIPSPCFDFPNGRRRRREAARQSVLAQKPPRRAGEGRSYVPGMLPLGSHPPDYPNGYLDHRAPLSPWSSSHLII
jgi:hypothetical protein